jgi:hypothetical protein
MSKQYQKQKAKWKEQGRQEQKQEDIQIIEELKEISEDKNLGDNRLNILQDRLSNALNKLKEENVRKEEGRR